MIYTRMISEEEQTMICGRGSYSDNAVYVKKSSNLDTRVDHSSLITVIQVFPNERNHHSLAILAPCLICSMKS